MAGLKAVPAKARIEINNAIKKSAITLQREAMIQAPVASGKLRGHINTRFGELIGTVMASTDYSASIEYGTKPHYVPTRALVNWATTKGIGRNNRYAFAKAVQRKIAQRGTKANPFMGRAVARTDRKVQQFFNIAGNNIAKKI